jgi:rod shape determining protein RodA
MNGLALWRTLRRHYDWPLLLVTMAIAGLGLLNLYSATHGAPQRGMFQQQIIWMLAGFGLFLIFSIMDYRFWLRLAWIALAIGLIAIVGVHFFGVVVKGSRRWLGYGSVRLQPSEFIKIAVILALARFAHDAASSKLSGLGIGARAAAFFVTVCLIAWQPDLGTAGLVALICVSVALLVMRTLWPIFVAGAVGGLALIPLWRFLYPYQKRRILTFFDPSSDPSGAGWHAQQSIFAVGSGRIGGKGYLHGTQNQLKFLPEHWTDFPFSVWAEEWGFLGSVALLGLYLFLILWTINIASQARDRFGATICIGVAAMLFWHVLVNIFMVTGLAPVVGVTLPLISYGGSSVLTVFIGLGLVASVSIRRYAH